jgi:LysR family transcriptional regulator, low CO2-responsive transcriptional regulator
MTPTQLRAFAAVVRLGSVKSAAAELGVSEAAISIHVSQLRKEFGDPLFTRTGAGLAFTPGGLRLAGRAVELLGLQDRTVLEVRQAGAGRRLLRLATSSLFAEYAAPGLISSFAGRAEDLDVELSVQRTLDFENLLLNRSVDAAIGPRGIGAPESITIQHFLNYQMVAVAAEGQAVTRVEPSISSLRSHTWLLGPSAAEQSGVAARLMQRIGVPEQKLRIFHNHAAALDEAKRGNGIALTPAFTLTRELTGSGLALVPGEHVQAQGAWNIWMLANSQAPATAEELSRFVTTPKATTAMLKGRGVNVGRFTRFTHVTLWS